MRARISATYIAMTLLLISAVIAVPLPGRSVHASTTTTTAGLPVTELLVTELLVIEEKGCVYCAKFDREISIAYPKTTEGKTAPLRRLDLHSEWPQALSHIERPRFTPTFILIHNNDEVGRLVGYNGDEYFWFLLGELLDKIEPAADTVTEPATEESGA